MLTASKIGVSIATHSVGVLSEAIHSGLDLISSIVTYFTVREAVRPADWNHPFGHGKMESLSAMLEAVLLLVAGGYIFYEGVSKWASGTHEVHHVDWGLAVTGMSVLVNLVVYFQNRGVAAEHESIAIETNSFHFLTDVFSSLAVFLSLGALKLTSWTFLDPAVALVIALYVGWVGVEQIKKCVAELSDTALPASEVTAVQDILDSHRRDYLNYHDLRTRKVGAVRHVELHLEVCSEQRVHQAHELCDSIERDLMQQFKEVDVNIHVEPCGNHGPPCKEVCVFYHQPRGKVAKNV